jgi:hypothetical protein
MPVLPVRVRAAVFAFFSLLTILLEDIHRFDGEPFSRHEPILPGKGYVPMAFVVEKFMIGCIRAKPRLRPI